MRKINTQLRSIVSGNLRSARMKKFPGHGGSKKCAEAMGVAPQQWSMWESGRRIPDECRLQEIAVFFGVTVASLYKERLEEEAAAHGLSSLDFTQFARGDIGLENLGRCRITDCVIHDNHELSVTVRLKDVDVVTFIQTRLMQHINSLE